MRKVKKILQHKKKFVMMLKAVERIHSSMATRQNSQIMLSAHLFPGEVKVTKMN